MIILGINNFFEHPSAALVCDGKLIFAVEDERFTRIKHGKRYTPYRTYIPVDSIYAALKSNGLCVRDLSEVACSYDRWSHFCNLWGCFFGKRLSSIQEELAAFRSVANVRQALVRGHEFPHGFRNILAPGDFAGVGFREWNHHLCHAASAFFCSGFKDAVIVVADGSGESACTSVFLGHHDEIKRIRQISLPNSLGFFYSFVTRHIGFEPFSDEYKVMGLAAYGEPRFTREMSEVVRLAGGGRYDLDLRRLRHLDNVLGPPRAVSEPLTQTHKDIAKSAQVTLEAALLHVVTYHMRETRIERLCLAGGTFLNCVANRQIARHELVQELFVQPAAHDAGTAVGAAALSWVRRGGTPQLSYESMFLGTEWTDTQIQAALDQSGASYKRLDETQAVNRVAQLLAQERVVALFRGRMEFGPRALGHRSVLASPRSARTRDKLNEIKGREQFRPLAPIVTSEAFAAFFEGIPNRYMMIAATVRPEARERIPAVVHADGTARPQIVSSAEDPFLYRVLESFRSLAGVPVLVNTSLNVRGKPIDESPYDALGSFYSSGLDHMLLGNFLVDREKVNN